MLYVLYENSGIHSGRQLRASLSKKLNRPVMGGFPARLAEVCRKYKAPEYVFNLGSTQALEIDAEIILNPRSKVILSSNKRRARRIFQEEGVPAPALYLETRAIPENGFPVVGRTSHHSKGKGFWLCHSRREAERAVAEGASHFMEFIPNTREYRVHLFVKKDKLKESKREAEDYVSIKISEKVWTGQGQPDPNEPQKNHHFGWSFLGPQDRRVEELDVVRQAAKEAIAALNLDFGAVDIMYQLRAKIPYVLEVNSAPSMSDDNANTCEVYTERIAKMLKE